MFRKTLSLALSVHIVVFTTFFAGCSIVPRAPLAYVVFSFDDQLIDTWYPKIVELKEKYPNFTVTLFVTRPDTIGTELWKYQELIELGIEIGGHNWRHENSVLLIDEYGEQAYRDSLEKNIEYWKAIGVDLKSYAYPYGSNNEQTDRIAAEYFQAIRDIHEQWLYDTAIGPQSVYGAFPIDSWRKSVDQTIAELEVLSSQGGVLVTFGHHIKSAHQPELVGVFYDELETYVKYCIANGIYIVTFYEAVQVIEAN